MSIFSKLFGSKDKDANRNEQCAARLSELTGLEAMPLAASGDLMELYKNEYIMGQRDGYTPIIVKPTPVLCDAVFDNAESCGADYRNSLSNAILPDAAAVLKERSDGLRSELDEEYDIYGDPDAIQQPVNKFVFADDRKDLVLFRVPVTEPWKAVAWFPFGGWNECPVPKEIMAVCRYWHEKYGAVPAAVTSDTLEFYVPQPVTDRAETLKLAEEQYAFCPDIVEQGLGTISDLAASLIGSTIWSFWWD